MRKLHRACRLSTNLRQSSARLQTQSDPPSDDCSESHGCGEVGCELIVAGGDATPILQPAEHALDEIALFVGVGVEGMEALAGWVVGDHGLGATLDQELAQPIAVIGGIANAHPCRRQRCEEWHRDADIAALAWSHLERDGAAATVDDRMDLRCAATA